MNIFSAFYFVYSRGPETTIIMLRNGSGEKNGLIDHEKMSCM